jgi:hypothetical protein
MDLIGLPGTLCVVREHGVDLQHLAFHRQLWLVPGQLALFGAAHLRTEVTQISTRDDRPRLPRQVFKVQSTISVDDYAMVSWTAAQVPAQPS